MLKLVFPSVKFKRSFLKAYPDRFLWMYTQHPFTDKQVKTHFGQFVKYIKSQSKGKNLPKTFIPHTVYWLVDGKKYLGTTDIRHKLNARLKLVGGHIGYEIAIRERGKGYGKEILRLALKKAKALGIKKPLVTCDATNIGSKKIIEHNGGRFLNKIYDNQKKIYKLRYSIKI